MRDWFAWAVTVILLGFTLWYCWFYSTATCAQLKSAFLISDGYAPMRCAK